MCYEVKCSSCSKSSWAGCGQHVPSVYQKIAEGQHCMCKTWPGVTLPSNKGAMANKSGDQPAQGEIAKPSTGSVAKS